MPKDKWRKYASQNRLFEKGYFEKHRNGSTGRKTTKASGGNRIQQSRKKQEEKIAPEIIDDDLGHLLAEKAALEMEKNWKEKKKKV